MPTKDFTLDEGAPKPLKIQWKGMWKNMHVTLAGQELGVIEDQKALKQGRAFDLPDGRILHIQLHTGFGNNGLAIKVNGQDIQGSATNPQSQINTAAGVAFFFAGMNLLLGLVAVIGRVAFLLAIGIGVGSIIFGAVMGGLGFFIRQRSRGALIAAMVLIVLDLVAGLYLVIQAGGTPSAGGAIIRIAFLAAMWPAYGAMGKGA